MNTFKKIAAVTLAAATLATTMITASAATISFATTGDVYGSGKSENVTHYLDINSSKDTVTYKSVDKSMMEGNKVLFVQYSPKNSTGRTARTMPAELRKTAETKVEDLKLVDAKGKYITSGTNYALFIDEMSIGSNGGVSVVVYPRHDLTSNFDITYVTARKLSNSVVEYKVNYKINNKYALPTYEAKLGYDTMANSYNDFGGFYAESGDKGVNTKGTLTVTTTQTGWLDLTIEGVKVGRIYATRSLTNSETRLNNDYVKNY